MKLSVNLSKLQWMKSRAVKLTMKNNFFKSEKRINAIIAVSKDNSSHDVVRVKETRNNTC